MTAINTEVPSCDDFAIFADCVEAEKICSSDEENAIDEFKVQVCGGDQDDSGGGEKEEL